MRIECLLSTGIDTGILRSQGFATSKSQHFLSFLFCLQFFFPHLSDHNTQMVCHDVLHKITALLIISIDCSSESPIVLSVCHWISVENHERTIFSMSSNLH